MSGRARLPRAPLVVQADVEPTELNPSGRDLLIKVRGAEIPVPELAGAEASAVRALRNLCKLHKYPRPFVNTLRPFLRRLGGSAASLESVLKEYRNDLNWSDQRLANTKAQQFSYVLRFVKEWQRLGEVPAFRLPPNLEWEPQVVKKNLFECAPVTYEALAPPLQGVVVELEGSTRLDRTQAAIVVVLLDRLERLRRHAVTEITAIRNAFRTTWTLINEAKSDGRLAAMRAAETYAKIRSRELSDLVLWSYAHYGLAIPDTGACDQSFYQYLKNYHGGFGAFRPLFHPTLKSLGPFLVLFLADPECAPDVDSAFFYTYRGCLEDLKEGSSAALTTLTFYKERPSPRRISKEIPRGASDETTLARALEFLHDYTEPMLDGSLRLAPDCFDRDHPERGMRLPLHYERQKTDTVRPMDRASTADVVRDFVERAAAADPALTCLVGKATGENFRSSHALLQDFLTGGDIFAVQRLLEHANADTSIGYVNRVETNTLHRYKMRAFHDYIASKIEEARAERLGNGFLCLERMPGLEADSDGKCSRYDLCWQCDYSKIVVGTPEGVAEWLAWEDLILSSRQALERSNPVKWEKVWLPLLAVYQTFLEKSSSRIRQQGEQLFQKHKPALPPLN